MSKETNVEHIWDFSNSLNAVNHTKRLLKSYYINQCRSALKAKCPYLGQMCSHCALFWCENEYNLKLITQAKSTKTSKSKRLIKKLEEVEKTQTQGILTKKQKKRAKWLRKRSQNQLQVHCKFCDHKTTLPLEKPKKKLVVPIGIPLEEATTKPLKKKKRKDKTAGLKIPILQTVLPPTAPIEEKQNYTKAPSIVQIKQSNANAKSKQKSKSTLKQNLKGPKHNQGKKLVTSKTQQQNTLLQLAELLKKQSSSNRMQNSLNALMK